MVHLFHTQTPMFKFSDKTNGGVGVLLISISTLERSLQVIVGYEMRLDKIAVCSPGVAFTLLTCANFQLDKVQKINRR